MATTTDQQSQPGVIGRVGGFVLGRRLPTKDEVVERLSKLGGLAILASDPLSSNAYATEELLLVLVLAGTAGISWSVPLSLAIVALLAILIVSYRQTIRAYPQGGGAYTVASENLGRRAGLVAAAGLLIDYVLTASVSVAAGSAALASAFPALAGQSVNIAIAAIVFLTLINLRGVRSTGRMFTIPTLLFVVTLLSMIAVGVYKVLTNQPVPERITPEPVVAGVTVFLLLRAFASGSAALTGVEAVANGVYMFKPPEISNARKVLLYMAVLMGALFFGITWLSFKFHVTPMADETVVSQVARVVFGSGPFYYLVQFSTMLILLIAANTAFSGFPRVAGILGRDRFLPRFFSSTGHRLVYSNGIIFLAFTSIMVVLAFHGEVHALIPIYAVGVFVSFTLSQAGMVKHWFKVKERHWPWFALINGTGALATGMALVIIAVTKFTHGAWAVILLVLVFLWIFRSVRRHYDMVARELSLEGYVPSTTEMAHTVIIPVSGVHRAVLEALGYARSLGGEVRAVYVSTDLSSEEVIRAKWKKYVPDIPLEVIHSPYRQVLRPFLRFIDEVRGSENRLVTVIIPTFVPMHWWEWFLHSQTAWLFHLALSLKRNVAVVTVHHQLR